MQKWTKKVDLFAKRLVVVPICEDSHWYVVVVCNPGMVATTKEEQGRTGREQSDNPFLFNETDPSIGL